MKAQGAVSLALDLRRYLNHRSTLFNPEMNAVVAEVNGFMSAVLRSGFRTAVTELLFGVDVRFDRPFIEVCNAIIDRQVRPLEPAHRDLVGKSLFEAYIYFAGTEYAFEPATKTRFMHTLRRREVKGFAELFLSLHLFNVIAMEIQEKVNGVMPDLRSFELYMLNLEALCRDIVTQAMKIPDGELDERWAIAVHKFVDEQLLRR
jgi:hypothetical protein